MVARWNADQQDERSILRQGHDSLEIHVIRLGFSPAQYSLGVQNRGLKYHSFHYTHYMLLFICILCPVHLLIRLGQKLSINLV